MPASIVLAIVVGIAWFADVRSHDEFIESRESSAVASISSNLESEFQHQFNDVRLVKGVIEAEGPHLSESADRLGVEILTLISGREAIRGITVISGAGEELLAVDAGSEAPQVTTPEADHSDSWYFQDVLAAQDEEALFYSYSESDGENSIRMYTPWSLSDSSSFGIILVDLDVESVLADHSIRDLHGDSHHLIFSDQSGTLLSDVSSARYTEQTYDPSWIAGSPVNSVIPVWARIGATNAGTISGDDALYSYITVRPFNIADAADVVLISETDSSREYGLKVIHRLSAIESTADKNESLNTLYILSAAIGILVLLGSIGVGRYQRARFTHNQQLAELENAKEWQRTFDSIVDGISIHKRDGTILRANKTLEKMLGVEHGEIIGKKCYRVFHDEETFIRGCPMHLSHTSQSSQTKEIFERKLGCWLSINTSPIQSGEAPEGSFVHSVRNVSARRQANEDRERLERAIQQSTESVIITDIMGFITYVNPATEELSKYSEDELVGKHLDSLSSEAHSDSVEGMWNALRSGMNWHGSLTRVTSDGDLYQEEANIVPISDDNGEIISFVSVARDVTEEVLLRRQLSQAQKLESIGELAAGIAHEINTPTQYIGDNLSFLGGSFDDLMNLLKKQNAFIENGRDGSEDSGALLDGVDEAKSRADMDFLLEEVPSAIRQSQTGIDNVSRIVRAMKEFSHPGLKEKRPTDINKAIRNAVTISESEWKYISELKLELAADLPQVPLVVGEFNQVILNLIINAAHAIAEKGSGDGVSKGLITLSSRLDESGVLVQVSDTGTGISKDIRCRIFDPFFTTKDVGTGTGQGLSISYAVIVEGHAGKIDFETEEGVGTTFNIYLPFSDTSEDPRDRDKLISVLSLDG